MTLRVITDLTHSSDITFTFQLRNPSRGQSASTVSLQGSLPGTGEGIFFSGVNMVTATASSLYPSTGDLTSPIYPLTVDTAFFTMRAIGQSSPFPCDDNTITVVFSTSTRLLASCTPKLTLTGLMLMRTNSSAQFAVTDRDGSARTGSWDQDNGALVLDLDQFSRTTENHTQLSGVDIPTHGPNYVQHETFNFSFVLRNPTASRSRQNVYAVASITSVRDKTQTLAVMESEFNSRNTGVGSSAHQVVLSDLNATEHMFLEIGRASCRERV